MKQTRYGHTVQLTRLGMVNSYLVIEDDGLTVVDTNLPGSAAGILAAAKSLEAPIRRIVLTHEHNDHVASADALHQLIPEAEVIASTRAKPILAGDKRLLPGEPVDKLRGGYTRVKTAITRLVDEGDRIGSLRVIAAPGHTPGQIALLDTRDGMLIAADAFQTLAGIAVSGQIRWRFPLPALATWHKPTALKTARRLLDLTPAWLAVGHGPVLENPAALMESAIAS
ncbi:MAG: MBL fold metallo-hydrolase, partial [Anaerolineae bacterium]|nr:MBL fold metallo-hydrolase [Anaerolineae bacterium]